jgi:hypothetical protein
MDLDMQKMIRASGILLNNFKMETIAKELASWVNKYEKDLRAIPEATMSAKPLPHKWSKKELLGHLIDSAQSNIRRFVAGQYEDQPKITYDQDKWVAANGYQQWDSKELIDLWVLQNKQVMSILKNISDDVAERMVLSEALHSIRWLAEDYLKHLRYHMHQLLGSEPFPYP